MKRVGAAIRSNLRLLVLAFLLTLGYAVSARAADEFGCGPYYQDLCIAEYGSPHPDPDGEGICTFWYCEVTWQGGHPHVNCIFSCT